MLRDRIGVRRSVGANCQRQRCGYVIGQERAVRGRGNTKHDIANAERWNTIGPDGPVCGFAFGSLPLITVVITMGLVFICRYTAMSVFRHRPFSMFGIACRRPSLFI